MLAVISCAMGDFSGNPCPCKIFPSLDLFRPQSHSLSSFFQSGVWRHSGGTRALGTTEATVLDAALVQDNGQRPRALLSTCLRPDEGILGKRSLTYGAQLKTTNFLRKPLKYNKQRRFTNLQGHSNQACGGAVGTRRRLSSYQGLWVLLTWGAASILGVPPALSTGAVHIARR